MLEAVVLAKGTAAAANPMVTPEVTPVRRAPLFAIFLWRGPGSSPAATGTLFTRCSGCGLDWEAPVANFTLTGWRVARCDAKVGDFWWRYGEQIVEPIPTTDSIELSLTSDVYTDYGYMVIQVLGSYAQSQTNSWSTQWNVAPDPSDTDDFFYPFTRPENGAFILAGAADPTETVSATVDYGLGYTKIDELLWGTNDAFGISAAMNQENAPSVSYTVDAGIDGMGTEGCELLVSNYPKTATVM